jgi:hypothetical protein
VQPRAAARGQRQQSPHGIVRDLVNGGPALAADQPLPVVRLVAPDDAALAAPWLPSRCLAIRADQLSAGQCTFYAVLDRVIQVGLDGEQGSDTYLGVDPICAAMVRRQRTWRIVIPVSAWSHGDRRARSPHISEGVDGQHGLVSVAGWSHGSSDGMSVDVHGVRVVRRASAGPLVSVLRRIEPGQGSIEDRRPTAVPHHAGEVFGVAQPADRNRWPRRKSTTHDA